MFVNDPQDSEHLLPGAPHLDAGVAAQRFLRPGPLSAPGPLPDHSMTDPSPLTTCLPSGRQSHERRMCQPHDRAAASCWDRCYAGRLRSQELWCRRVLHCCRFPPGMPSASSCSSCNSSHARMALAGCRHPELQRKCQLQCNSLHAKETNARQYKNT